MAAPWRSRFGTATRARRVRTASALSMRRSETARDRREREGGQPRSLAPDSPGGARRLHRSAASAAIGSRRGGHGASARQRPASGKVPARWLQPSHPQVVHQLLPGLLITRSKGDSRPAWPELPNGARRSAVSWLDYGPEGRVRTLPIRRDAPRARRTGAVSACGRRSPPSDGQTLPALCATGVDDRPAAARFHTDEEAVSAGATNFRCLIGAFHDELSLPGAGLG